MTERVERLIGETLRPIKETRTGDLSLSTAANRMHQTAEQLVKKLMALDCKLSVAGDRLVVTPDGEQIPPLLLMQLRQHKSAIVELLKQRAAPPAPPSSAPSAPPLGRT
jgi:hypothetical protein